MKSSYNGGMNRRLCVVFRLVCVSLGALSAAVPTGCAGRSGEGSPIVLRTMGSLFFGGTLVREESGETFHGDHGYAQFFIPLGRTIGR